MAFLDLLPIPRVRFGAVLPFSKLYFYEAGTTTPLATYSDTDGEIAHKNTNPVIADSGGLFGPIFILPLAYKVVLKTTAGVEVFTQDDVRNPSVGATEGVIDVRAYGAIDDNSDASADANQAAIQAAIDASYGKALYFPIVDTGIYKFTGPLRIDATNLTPIRLFGDGTDAFGGFPGRATVLSNVGANNGIEISNFPVVAVAEQSIIIEDLVVKGDGADATGGDGVNVLNCANVQLRNMWVRDCRRHGVYFDTCFVSQLQDVTLNRNRFSGFFSNGAFHLGRLVSVRAFSNGRTYSSGPMAGILLSGNTGGSSAPRIESFDCESQGQDAFRMYKRSDNTLTSIAVNANVATVTTPTAHGRSIGELIIVQGATVDTDLNSGTTYAIASTPTPTTFTFATVAVANATYTESTLYIGPWVPGLYVGNASGLVVENFYCESGNLTSAGSNAVYAGSDCIGASFIGSYSQGGTLFFDLCVGGSISGYQITGFAGIAGISVASNDPRTQIDVSSDNQFILGATLIQPTIFKQGGRFFSPVVAAPATGTWVTGDQIWFTNAVSGGPPGIYCTAGGSHGTWKNMANLA